MTLFGHRGARGEAPENTLSGFRYALKTGANGIELDVRLTKDEQLAVIHDETVDRTAFASGPVSSFTAEQLHRLDACKGWAEWPEPSGIPTLRQVLELLVGVPHLQIELKKDTPERLRPAAALLIEEIDRFGIRGHIVVTSFEAAALEIVKTMRPDQSTALISMNGGGNLLSEAKRLGCAGVCMYLPKGSRLTVFRAHELGMAVTGWLGNAPEDVSTLMEWGVDSITSDYPGKIAKYMRDRGWL